MYYQLVSILRLASVYEAIFMKQKFTLAKMDSEPLFLVELVTGMLLTGCFPIQASFVHDYVYVSAQSVHVSDLLSRSVLDCKVHPGQLQAPPHQAMVVVSEIWQICKSSVIRPNKESSPIQISPKIFCGPNES